MFDFIAQNGLVFGLLALVVVAVAILGFLASRLKTVAPDKVLIVVSMGGRNTTPRPPTASAR